MEKHIKQARFKLAAQDLIAGMVSWRIWLLLGWQDIRLRYRRSQLGPFWLTISMAVTIYSMGFLYGHLFKMDLNTYFPFLASGLLVWTLIATTINESTNCFIEATSYLKQMKLPYIVFVLRIVTRNFIIFCHNIIAVIPIIIFCHIKAGWWLLALPFGIFIVLLNGMVYGVILAMLGARFRDIAQIIVSLMQVFFFMTPVMWVSSKIPPQYQFVVKLNPFAQFIDLVRAPLLGVWPSLYSYLTTLAITAIGIALMLLIYYRGRHRIIYWL
jgi:lipopolysaccharide transport system permease protein